MTLGFGQGAGWAFLFVCLFFKHWMVLRLIDSFAWVEVFSFCVTHNILFTGVVFFLNKWQQLWQANILKLDASFCVGDVFF